MLSAARLLGPNSVLLTGDRASMSTLKVQDLSSFDVLHFAVHAFADPKFPEGGSAGIAERGHVEINYFRHAPTARQLQQRACSGRDVPRGNISARSARGDACGPPQGASFGDEWVARLPWNDPT